MGCKPSASLLLAHRTAAAADDLDSMLMPHTASLRSNCRTFIALPLPAQTWTSAARFRRLHPALTRARPAPTPTARTPAPAQPATRCVVEGTAKTAACDGVCSGRRRAAGPWSAVGARGGRACNRPRHLAARLACALFPSLSDPTNIHNQTRANKQACPHEPPLLPPSLACAAGYGAASDSSPCELCPAGTFSAAGGNSTKKRPTCTSCPAGFTSNMNGATSAGGCDIGEFRTWGVPRFEGSGVLSRRRVGRPRQVPSRPCVHVRARRTCTGVPWVCLHMSLVSPRPQLRLRAQACQAWGARHAFGPRGLST